MQITHSKVKDVFYHNPNAQAGGFSFSYYNYPLHDHEYYEINLVFSGSGLHTIGDRSFQVSTGDVFVIPPGIRHGYATKDPEFTVYHLVMKSAFLEENAKYFRCFSGFSILFEMEPFLRLKDRRSFLHLEPESLAYVKTECDFLSQVFFSNDREGELLAAAQAFKLVGYLCRQMKQVGISPLQTPAPDWHAVFPAISYIHLRYPHKISVDLLAARCNMSRATFVRRFKKACGVPPAKYLAHYRLQQAKLMLKSGRSKTGVAHDCGFFDSSHLDKCLKSTALS